jgi:hypothetical protein
MKLKQQRKKVTPSCSCVWMLLIFQSRSSIKNVRSTYFCSISFVSLCEKETDDITQKDILLKFFIELRELKLRSIETQLQEIYSEYKEEQIFPHHDHLVAKKLERGPAEDVQRRIGLIAFS